jgi:hypothetical protein
MPTPLTLKVYRGDDLVRTEQFARDIIKIGRLPSAHLCLEDERISRIHSVIEVAADGSVSIIDMGSAEGTFVNGKRVNRGPLHTGDQVGLGGLRILVEEGPAASAAPATAIEPAAAAGTEPGPATAAELGTATAAPGAPEQRLDETTGAEPLPQQGAPIARLAAATVPPTSTPTASRTSTPTAPGAASAARPSRAARPKGTRLQPSQAAPKVERKPRAPEPEPDGGPVGDLGVELRMLWGETLLDAGTFLRPSRPVLVGETRRCDFRLSGPDLPVAQFPILRFEDGEYRVLFARGMGGDLEEKGARTPLSQLVKERRAAPDGAIDGAYAVPVPRPGAVRVAFGSGIRMEARFKRPPKPAMVPWWERINYQFLNLFLVLFFLQAGFIVAAANFPYGTDTVADDLFKNPSRMAKFIIKPPEQQPKVNPYLEKLQRELRREQPGEMAERHKGAEGQMGKKDAPRTSGRSAPKAIDPNAKDIVKNTGLVGLLGRGKAGGLSTIFGQGGLGGDLKGAIGNMFGPVVGDSYGLGGLGLKGSGPGGGGAGETIGIGGVGTKGRGGGLGSYGTGVGGLGKKGDRDVSITSSTPLVVGYDKELVRKVIRDHEAQIRYCYEQELQRNPKLEGKVAIRWTINPDGRVSNLQLDGATTLDDKRVQDCMMSRIATWEFPKPKGGGIAIITYPWILRTSGGTGG